MTDIDPFDEGVPRGRYGRPLIIPAGRGGKPNLKAPLVEYDRASTVADALDTGGGIATWQTRHAAVGIACNPDLAALVAALGRNPDTFSADDKRNLDAIIERAHDRSGGNEKADYGTAVHSLTEPGNDGVTIPLPKTTPEGDTVLVDSMAPDVASYVAMIAEVGIEVDATEVFVVNDDLKTAGTFDHAYRFTRELTAKLNGVDVTIPAGTKVIGDKKTGSLHFDAHAIQLAIYARGKKYDHVTGEREALDVSPQYGVIAHIPREGGKTTLHLVDLSAGWHAAKLAVQVREYTLGARKRLSTAIATCEAPVVEPAAVPAADVDPFSDTVSQAVAQVDEVVRQIAAVTATPPRTVDEPAPVVDDQAAKVAADAAKFETALANARAATQAANDPQPEPVVEPAPPVEPVAEQSTVPPADEPVDPMLYMIATAETRDACHAIWRDNRHAWSDEYTEAVKARLALLPAAS